MIRGVHTMFYSSEPEAFRAFLRDKLGFRAYDVGKGWLIFDLPEADMGCHPADASGKESAFRHSGHLVLLRRHRANGRRAEGRGVEFTAPVTDRGYGLVTFFRVPGAFEVQLYQPRYSKSPGGSA